MKKMSQNEMRKVNGGGVSVMTYTRQIRCAVKFGSGITRYTIRLR